MCLAIFVLFTRFSTNGKLFYFMNIDTSDISIESSDISLSIVAKYLIIIFHKTVTIATILVTITTKPILYKI